MEYGLSYFLTFKIYSAHFTQNRIDNAILEMVAIVHFQGYIM